MQILPVNFNLNNTKNKTLKNISNSTNVSFQAKREIVGVSTDALKSETAKKLYSKIQKYLRLIGNEGSVKNIKLMKENSRYYLQNNCYYNYFDSEADIFLSIERNNKKTNMSLSRKYADVSKNVDILLNATFDKEGQMVRAQFPPENLYFERKNANLRRMHFYDRVYTPVGGNDREWEYNGARIPNDAAGRYKNDDSSRAAFEIFLELARLKTSITK